MKSVFWIYGQEVLLRMPAVWDRKHLCPQARRNSAAKFYLVKLHLEVQLLTFLYISFERKGTLPPPYTVNSIGKWYPFQT